MWNLNIAFWRMGVFYIPMKAGMGYRFIIIPMKISKKRFMAAKFLQGKQMDAATGMWL